MHTPHSPLRDPRSALGAGRSAFTLMELLIVLTIITILVGLSMAALVGATEQARAARTRAIINKIDLLIDERYQSYRTRAVPIRINPSQFTNASPAGLWAARVRLYALRELMRMEMPDRKTDIVNSATTNPPTPEITVIPGMTQSSLQASYYRSAVRATGGNPMAPATHTSLNNWTSTHQGSECLYLILSAMRDGEKGAIEYFSTAEIGDVDGDGMKEILDAWGQPIEFLRWAPGYSEHVGPDGAWGNLGDDDGNGSDDIFEAGWPGSDDIVPLTLQTRIAVKNADNPEQLYAPDPFDPLGVDPRSCGVAMTASGSLGTPFQDTSADTAVGNNTFALKPLIFSAGPDKVYDVATILEDVVTNVEFRYSQTHTYTGGPRPPNDPYFVPPAAWGSLELGSVGDLDSDGSQGWADNITNHYQENN